MILNTWKDTRFDQQAICGSCGKGMPQGGIPKGWKFFYVCDACTETEI